MWNKLIDALSKYLDKIITVLSTLTLVTVINKERELNNKLEIRDEVKAIKDANTVLSRDQLIGLLPSDDK